MVQHGTKTIAKKEVPKRTRAFSTRAKTGCKTCKVRHVKCDEGRPGCKKCAQTGRQCDGYAHCTPSSNSRLSILSSAPASRSSNLSTTQSPSIIPELVSASYFSNEEERHSLHFFHKQTAPQLTGYFGSKFWDSFVLQASDEEASVRHAAIALGSMHERFRLDDGSITAVEEDTEENAFALRHYVRAINCLVQPNISVNSRHTKRSANVALTACMLFICFETLRGHYNEALSHIDGGIKILSELESTENINTTSASSYSVEDIPVSIFRVIFGRLDAQASIHSSRAYMIDGPESALLPSPIPEVFETVEQAREALESVSPCGARNIISCSMYNGIPLPLTTPETVAQSLARLNCWSRAFEAYLGPKNKDMDKEPIEPAKRSALNTLRIHKTITEVLLSASSATRSTNEMLWDAFKFEYDTITRWAAEIIQANSGPRKEPAQGSIFTLENGIVQPLLLVATKCRHRHIRRRAIALLNQANRQEGLWNSKMTAKIAERIQEIEDDGLTEAQDIVPDMNRLRDVNIKFELEDCAGRRAWLAFRHERFSPMSDIGEWISLQQTDILSVDMIRSISEWTASTIHSEETSWAEDAGSVHHGLRMQEVYSHPKHLKLARKYESR